MCSKCGKVNISGVPQYRAQLSVYDNSEQAVFVLLGDDAGFELTGKHAAELVSSYVEVCEASKIRVDSAEGSKSNGDLDEMGKAKRLKRGV
ncbi:unnamed protein product [Brassica napus]|uniref:(rape) hypothetical protein n=1 Tax=Brassica napus TaxID=3708 RepID=A0A816IHM9_BRANA|nr:unnamed protein product [Brassica napus]